MSVQSPSPQPSLAQFASDALSGPRLTAPVDQGFELKLDANRYGPVLGGKGTAS